MSRAISSTHLSASGFVPPPIQNIFFSSIFLASAHSAHQLHLDHALGDACPHPGPSAPTHLLHQLLPLLLQLVLLLEDELAQQLVLQTSHGHSEVNDSHL